MERKSPLSPRKKPRQRRSQETVDAILEAATRVFSQLGHVGGTTNHIAEAAGVSIGSLYEYFPNKDAILVAVVERQLDDMMVAVRDHLIAARDHVADPAGEASELGALLRRFVVAMLEAHDREPDLYRVVFSEAPHPPELHACVLQMEGSLAYTLEEVLVQACGLQLADSHTAAHLVVQTTEALTHRFVHHGLHEIERDRFVDEVTLLLEAYLRAAGLSPAS